MFKENIKIKNYTMKISIKEISKDLKYKHPRFSRYLATIRANDIISQYCKKNHYNKDDIIECIPKQDTIIDAELLMELINKDKNLFFVNTEKNKEIDRNIIKEKCKQISLNIFTDAVDQLEVAPFFQANTIKKEDKIEIPLKATVSELKIIAIPSYEIKIQNGSDTIDLNSLDLQKIQYDMAIMYLCRKEYVAFFDNKILDTPKTIKGIECGLLKKDNGILCVTVKACSAAINFYNKKCSE